MNRNSLRFSLITCLACPATILCSAAAQAQNQNNSWAQQQAENQRLQNQALQQLAAQRQTQAQSPQAQQFERWKQEWIQQHPGEPLPSFGVLEHLHSGELVNSVNNGFAKMREQRQAQLQADRQLAKQNQERALAAQHITWSEQQWNNWYREYDQQMQQRANEYRQAVIQDGEMQREEQRRKALGW